MSYFGPALAAVLAALVLATPARAQAPDGAVTGVLVPPAPGAVDLAGVTVQLVALEADGAIATLDATTDAEGRFALTAPADPTVTYLVRAAVQGVAYFTPTPVLLSPDLPSADVAVKVFPATTEAPALRIATTTVTMLALDRQAAQITLVREDTVVNPGPATYVGDGTLRFPLPEDTVEASGGATYDGIPSTGDFAVAGDTLATDVPLRPGETLVVTRYLVAYEPAVDAYRLRVTAPLPTAAIELRVPERFVGRATPEGDATRAGSVDVAGEPLLVIAAPAASDPGRGVLATIEGLSGRNPPNPLTQRAGAVAGAALAIALIAAGALLGPRLAARLRPGAASTP